MGTLFSALGIGQAGLFVAQMQLDVAAHNIANVNRVGFSRQRVNVTTNTPLYYPFGALGRGPMVSGIQRIREAFLDTVFRRQSAALGRAETQAQYFARIEDIFQEPNEHGFTSRLSAFFDSLNDFANNVESMPVRMATLSQAEAMAASLNEVAQRLRTLRINANEEVRNLVPEVNSLAERIAALNNAIRSMELGGRSANDLRDDRDVLLDELSSIVNITYRERDDGQVDVLLGGQELVTGRNARRLITQVDPSIDPSRPDLLAVRFEDNDEAANIRSGRLYGALYIRDVEIRNLETRMNEIARALIQSLNDIQARGRGLRGFNTTITGAYAASSSSIPLNQALLPYSVQDGSFAINVFDAAGGLVESITIPIVASGPDPGQTTLADIEAAINTMTNLSATVTADGRLSITPDSGYTFMFSDDTAGAVMALGLNAFFVGDSAASIALNPELRAHPEWLSSGFSANPLETGDNSAALAMAALRSTPILGGQSINEYYESTIVQVGIDARANSNTLSVEEAFIYDLSLRRQEVSGVNLDEEVTSLLMFQRAYEASARVITVADRMLDTLLNIVR